MNLKTALLSGSAYILAFIIVPYLIFSTHTQQLQFIFPYKNVIYALGSVMTILTVCKTLFFKIRFIMTIIITALMISYVYIIYAYSSIEFAGSDFNMMITYFNLSILFIIIIIARTLFVILHFRAKEI